MSYFKHMCQQTGYQPITDIWYDFTVADLYGQTNILKLYDKYFNEFKNEYKKFTELVMVLNWKTWEHYHVDDIDLSEFYADLFYKAQDYGYENFKGEELNYFWRTLD